MNIFGLKIKLPWEPQKEKRKGERSRVFESLYVDYKSPDASFSGSSEALDISCFGIRFPSSIQFDAGRILDLTLRFTPGVIPIDRMQLKGIVMHCNKVKGQKVFLVACSFAEIDIATQNQLQQFVDWLKAQREKYLFYRWRSKDADD